MKKKIKYSFEQWCTDNNHLDYLDLWDYELNGISPNDVSCGTKEKYYFKCPRRIHPSEQTAINQIKRRGRLYCRHCGSLGQWIIDNFGIDELYQLWSPKNTCGYYDISCGSDRKIWIKCKNNQHPDYLISCAHFMNGKRCPVCANKKIIPGINDVATTHPEYVKYFKNPEEATLYGCNSEHRCDFICPDCGAEKNRTIYNVTSYGFTCDVCGRGSSYPNRFIGAMLQYLQQANTHKIKFQFSSEKIFEWSKNIQSIYEKLCGFKRYDFYLYRDVNIIIEAHGLQHYEEVLFTHRTLKEEQENDRIKQELALKNGFTDDCYVVLDCRYSDCEFIKRSIMNSQLPKLLNFNEFDVDWSYCEKVARTSLFNKSYELWNSGITNTYEIGRRLGISRASVENYLKKADVVGLCDYNSRYNRPIVCTDNDYVFISSKCCEDHSIDIFGVQLKAYSIRRVACGDGMQTQGFHFKYITKKEFILIKATESWRIIE